MSKLLRWAGITLVALLIVASLAGLAVYAASNRHLHQSYTVQPAPIDVPSGADVIERGRHIAVTRGCNDCHGADLGGAKVIENPAMGVLHGANLTRGQGGKTANYQDIDWVRSIRHGVNPEGRPLILMPSEEYSQMSNSDLGALIAFLKSAPPVNRESVPVKLGPVARALVLAGKFSISAEHIDHTNLRPTEIAPAVSAEYGRYLAVGCTGCHNPSFSGGKIDAGPPDWPPAANLTPHASGRLAKWSETDFITTLRTAHRPDGTELNIVMPRNFGKMNDTELKALWAYLKTLPAKPTGQR